jgi:predicted flap endonuclease-1-like 5' DNA nuclease
MSNNEQDEDDLARIEGIGPKVAGVLKGAGITTFDALAHAEPAKIRSILNEAGLRMMNPEGWIEQAQLAAKEDWDRLQKLQDELVGGRRV